MTYIIRFNDREGEHTHLVYDSPHYRVAHHAGGGKRTSYTADEATTFPNEAAAYEALGRFIADRGMLTDKCWISNPAVIAYDPPKLLSSSSVGGTDVSLHRERHEGCLYVVRWLGQVVRYVDYANAVSAYLKAVKELL